MFEKCGAQIGTIKNQIPIDFQNSKNANKYYF